MNKYLKELLASICLAILSLGFCSPAYPDTRYESVNKPGISSKFNKSRQNESKRNNSVRLLADFSAAIEAAGVSGGDYTAIITRKLQFDALRIRDWFLQFGVREYSMLDPSPSQLDHELEYLGIGYKIADGGIKLFWDHTCHNPSRKLPKEKRNDIHWNELGIGYETTGMMLGHKNDGVKFNSGSEWLNNINWRASLSKIWMRTENEYEWMFELGVRDDVFRICNQVFYIQVILNSIYDDRGITIDPCLEIGDRIRLNENIYLIPFVSYTHFHDWYSLDKGEDFFFAGLCLEMGLGQENFNTFSNSKKVKVSWAPKFHINGGYANIIDNEDYGHSSDLVIDLELLQLDREKTLSVNTYVGILTLPHDLNPYVVIYKIGPSLEMELDNLDLMIFHSYSCLYGLEDTGVVRDYNLLGLELKNSDTSRWNWDVKIGVYPSTQDFDYWGDLYGSLGYDFCKEGVAPHINCSGHYLQGSDSVFGYAVEAGVRIPGKAGSCNIYLCLQDDFDVFRFGKGRQTLLGIRFKF